MQAYCVILRHRPQPLKQSYYLRAASALQAVSAALAENPACELIGVEPGSLSAHWLQSDPHHRDAA